MKKYLIVYYSKTGNSAFISKQIAYKLDKSDVKVIRPRINNTAFLLFLTRLKINSGTGISQDTIEAYDEVIIIGPLWAGYLIAPLRQLIKQCIRANTFFHFAITCDSKDEDKDDKYGYAQAIEQVKDMGGPYLKQATAFPTALVQSDEQKESKNPFLKVRFNKQNFNGQISDRLNVFIDKIRSSN